jgi:hypothetical protein
VEKDGYELIGIKEVADAATSALSRLTSCGATGQIAADITEQQAVLTNAVSASMSVGEEQTLISDTSRQTVKMVDVVKEEDIFITPLLAIEKFNDVPPIAKASKVNINEKIKGAVSIIIGAINHWVGGSSRRRRLATTPSDSAWAIDPDEAGTASTPATLQLTEFEEAPTRRRSRTRRSLLSVSTRKLDSSEASVQLRNTKPATYIDVAATLPVELTCEVKDTPYTIPVECTHYDASSTSLITKTHELACPGTERGNFTYTCPEVVSKPYCQTWDSSANQYKVADECFMSAFDADSTTCSCSVESRRRRRLDETDGKLLQIATAMGISETIFDPSWESWPYPSEASSEDDGSSSNGALFGGVVGAVLFTAALGYYAKRKVAEKQLSSVAVDKVSSGQTLSVRSSQEVDNHGGEDL